MVNAFLKNNLSSYSTTLSVVCGIASAVTIEYRFVQFRNRINDQRGAIGFAYVFKASNAGIIE